MAEIVLVHGAGFGSWCWDLVMPHLPGARAVDLPAPARSGHAIADCTLEAQAQTILAAQPAPGWIVAHSAGGFAATLAALIAPDRVQGLIHLCGYVPNGRDSLARMRRDWPDQPLRGAILREGGSYRFTPEAAPALFFHDCPADLAAKATARLVAEPRLPHETPLAFATPPPNRHYILAEGDRTIPPDFQRQMARGLRLHALPGGHCPFLARPADLAALIARITT